MVMQLEFSWFPGPAVPSPETLSTPALSPVSASGVGTLVIPAHLDAVGSDDSPALAAGPDTVRRFMAPRAEMQRAADALLVDLRQRTHMALCLRITDNTATVMAVRHDVPGQAARVSLHHMFLHAPDPVLSALAQWIRHPKSRVCAPVLNGFIRDQRHLIQPRKPQAPALRTQGRHVQLSDLFDALNAQYFSGAVTSKITWGKMPVSRRCRSIRFGSYEPKANVIRIHPLLDQEFVPQFFVEYIVYHEMLHAFLGVQELPSGRRSIHGKEFQRREKDYPGYDRALAWMNEPAHLQRLLRRGNSSRPLSKA